MENLVFADPQSPQSVTLGPYSDEDITFEFHKVDEELRIEAACAGRKSEGTHQLG